MKSCYTFKYPLGKKSGSWYPSIGLFARRFIELHTSVKTIRFAWIPVSTLLKYHFTTESFIFKNLCGNEFQQIANTIWFRADLNLFFIELSWVCLAIKYPKKILVYVNTLRLSFYCGHSTRLGSVMCLIILPFFIK